MKVKLSTPPPPQIRGCLQVYRWCRGYHRLIASLRVRISRKSFQDFLCATVSEIYVVVKYSIIPAFHRAAFLPVHSRACLVLRGGSLGAKNSERSEKTRETRDRRRSVAEKSRKTRVSSIGERKIIYPAVRGCRRLVQRASLGASSRDTYVFTRGFPRGTPSVSSRSYSREHLVTVPASALSRRIPR